MDPEQRTSDLLRRHPRIREELLERAARGQVPELGRHGLAAEAFTAAVEGRRAGRGARGAEGLEAGGPRALALEAIVRRYGRPSLLIRNGTYEPPDLPAVADELAPHRAAIERVVPLVGRVEFVNHRMPWGGTGWVVERNVVITNRHVAELVAGPDGRGGFRFLASPAGVPYGARLDFREEHQVAVAQEIPVTRVRYLARSDQPDIALLEMEGDIVLPEPLGLSEAALAAGQPVGVIGYPAYDSRNDPEDVARYFGDIFDVKRLAPGEVTQAPGEQQLLMHDATTLGGNSGSVVFDLASGQPVALHFAGSYLVGNYAVSASHIMRALRGLRTLVTVPVALRDGVERPDGRHAADHFRDRAGYDPEFLGPDARRVALPGLGRWQADAVAIGDAGGQTTPVIPYTHFSVAFSTSRKVPLFTAVNVDGAAWRKIKRGDDQWFADLRLPAAIQLTREDYGHPAIDRGHMVRREDPNWGTAAEARRANDDTFHYTNAAPQHARLNQGTTQWLGLESYVLDSARTEGLRISVFTGPILRDTDPRLDNGVRVPEEFWKVVAAIDAETHTLRATGYVLSQGRLIEDITEGFVYGEYRGYQVAVTQIARATGLDFGVLEAADALRRHPVPEAAPGVPVVIPLDRLENMVL